MHTPQSCYWSRIRTLAVLTALGSILASPLATHAEPLFVATPQINGVPGTLWRLEDTNGDLDALDPGEKTVFRNIAGIGILTEDFVDVAASRSGTVYAVESDGRGLKLQNLNNAGDAQDAGEAQVFRDHKAQGFRLKSAFSIAVSRVYDLTTQQLRDVVYVSDPSLQATVKLEDIDGDGQAQGTEGICLYHESTQDKPLTAQRMTPDETDRLLAVDPNIQGVLRLFDFNQDCTVIPPTGRDVSRSCFPTNTLW